MDEPEGLLGAGMISFVKRAYDNFFGAGDAAVTVPPMDGALLPNDALDRATLEHETAAPDNLVLHQGRVLFSSGRDLLAANSNGEPERIATFENVVLAMASDGGDTLAIAVSGAGIVIRGGRTDGSVLRFDPSQAQCVTALCFQGKEHLVVAVGSSQVTASDWACDLLRGGATGCVLRVSLSGESMPLAQRLAWPAGVLALADGRIVVSEAWRHRLVLLSGATPQTQLGNLPAYPGRLSVGDGHTWLSLFAPRRQMIEFILREKEFRETMMRDIEPELWMAPTLRPSASFREPLQGGAVKQLGVLKPWAPTRSYGLLVRLGENFVPQASLHSRADGRRHGITSSVVSDGRLFVTSRGGDAVLSLPAASNGGTGL